MWIGATQGSAKACDGVDALQRRSVDSVTASSSDGVDKATRLATHELASTPGTHAAMWASNASPWPHGRHQSSQALER